MNKLTEYKGRTLDRTALYDLMEKAELTNRLMSIVFALRMDDDYGKEDAIKSILDIITEYLDFEFVNPAEEKAWHKDYIELQQAKKRIKQLKEW